MTKKYELVCIFDPQLGEAAFDPLVEKYEAKLKSEGAEIVNIDRWGLRKMAYTSAGLKQRQQGYYVLYQFTAEPGSLEDLLLELKMDEGLLRHLLVSVTGEFVRVPQLAPENVYVYKRPDRDFRGGPGGRGRFRSDRDRRPDSRRPDDRRPDSRRPEGDRPADRPADKPADRPAEGESSPAEGAEATDTPAEVAANTAVDTASAPTSTSDAGSAE